MSNKCNVCIFTACGIYQMIQENCYLAFESADHGKAPKSVIHHRLGCKLCIRPGLSRQCSRADGRKIMFHSWNAFLKLWIVLITIWVWLLYFCESVYMASISKENEMNKAFLGAFPKPPGGLKTILPKLSVFKCQDHVGQYYDTI